jgi:hypothetical protein
MSHFIDVTVLFEQRLSRRFSQGVCGYGGLSPIREKAYAGISMPHEKKWRVRGNFEF